MPNQLQLCAPNAAINVVNDERAVLSKYCHSVALCWDTLLSIPHAHSFSQAGVEVDNC
jgi:hypothetical protein